MPSQTRRPAMSRTVSFSFQSPVDIEGKTDNLLAKEMNKPGTPLTQWGTDGLFLWICGKPGKDLRAVIAQIKDLGWEKKTISEDSK